MIRVLAATGGRRATLESLPGASGWWGSRPDDRRMGRRRNSVRRRAGKLTARDSQKLEALVDDGADAELSDVRLIDRLASGDAQALGELYQRHGSTIFRVLRRYVRNVPEAELEDLCQEVFLTCFEVAGRFKGQGSVRSWLCGIAVRHGRNRRRKGWVRDGLMLRFGGQSTGLAHEIDNSVETAVFSRIEITRALEVLSDAQREVLLLHVIDNLSGEEIAPDGKKKLNRVTWYDNEDGTVRQHWEQSEDGGKTWKNAFDGLYRRKG